MSKSKINVVNFEILMQAIMDNYQSFNMYFWGTESKDSPCGTVGCIAGTADWLANKSGMEPAEGCEFLFNKNGSINQNSKTEWTCNNGKWSFNNAAKWLGITKNQASLLFNVHIWPDFFREELSNTYASTKQHARIAVSRIQYFLDTGN